MSKMSEMLVKLIVGRELAGICVECGDNPIVDRKNNLCDQCLQRAIGMGLLQPNGEPYPWDEETLREAREAFKDY